MQHHFRTKLPMELRALLIDKVPKDAKYAEKQSELNELIKMAFESRIVERAVSRVTDSFKRRRTLVEDAGSDADMISRVTLPSIMIPESSIAQRDDNQSDIDIQPRPCFPDKKDSDPSSALIVDSAATPFDLPLDKSLNSRAFTNFDTTATDPFEYICPSAFHNEVAPQTGDRINDWLNFSPELIPQVPPIHFYAQNGDCQDYSGPILDTIVASNAPVAYTQGVIAAGTKRRAPRNSPGEIEDYPQSPSRFDSL